jgi:hypothetical protein
VTFRRRISVGVAQKPVELHQLPLGRMLDKRLPERCTPAASLSLAGLGSDDAGAPFKFYLCSRVSCRGGGLDLVPARLRRSSFRALTTGHR